MNILVKILVAIASIASIAFGVWHFFVPNTMEVVFLHRSHCHRTDRCRSGDQCLLFFIFGFVWSTKSPVHFWRSCKSIFDYCFTGCDLYFVADKVVVSTDLPARFNQPSPPIRDVRSLHNNKSLLRDLTMYYGITKNYCLATFRWFGKSQSLS